MSEYRYQDDFNDNDNKKRKVKKVSAVSDIFYDLYRTIVLTASIIAIILSFVIRPVAVEGDSMNSTLFDSDKILISEMFYTPEINDIVVVAHNKNLDKEIIKRVIAKEGQNIRINYETGDVFVDGILIDEPYINNPTGEPVTSWKFPTVIPKGKVFVMGDNRQHSADSRSSAIGLIDEKDIIGKAVTVIYPFDRFKFINSEL